MLTKINQFICWLTGHHTMMRTELLSDARGGYTRVWLECIECGYTSKGWSFGDHYIGPKP